MLSSSELKKKDSCEAISELDKAKDLLGNSIRFVLFYCIFIGIVFILFYCIFAPNNCCFLNQNPK